MLLERYDFQEGIAKAQRALFYMSLILDVFMLAQALFSTYMMAAAEVEECKDIGTII